MIAAPASRGPHCFRGTRARAPALPKRMTGAAINKALVRLAQQDVYRYTLGWWKTARVDPYPSDPSAPAVILTQKNVQGITVEAGFGLDPSGWPPPARDFLERFTRALEYQAALALKIPFASVAATQDHDYNLQLAMAARSKYSVELVAAAIPASPPPQASGAPAVYLSLAQVQEMTRVLFVSANPALAEASDEAQVEADTAALEAAVDAV